jgi:K+-transporting ATPase c subunit
MYYAQLTNGIVTSVTETTEALPESPDHIVIDSFNMSLIGKAHDGVNFHKQIISLEQAKAAKIAQIRQAQAEKINALAWRVERAKERELIGAVGESVIEVLTLRENIRQKGNIACANVEMLTDLQSVQGFDWSI